MEKPPTSQLAHTSIWVRDLDKTLALYRDLLGMPVVKLTQEGPPERHNAALGLESNYLEVFQRPETPLAESDARHIGLDHLSVWVEDMEGLVARLDAAGYPLMGGRPIRRAPNWVGASLKVAWIQDPDGVRVEMLEWVGPAEPK